MFDLIQTTTTDDLVLSALFSPGDTSKPVLLNIHGFEGDFFGYPWVRQIALALQKRNIAFVSAQNRGMGSAYEFPTTPPDIGKRIGGNFELLREAYLDIDAWISWLIKQGYHDIILQGHSLGTFKVVRYMFEGTYKDRVKKLILLAPFDKTALIQKITGDKRKEYVKIAQQMVAEGKGRDIIPHDFEEVAISYQTYVSWYEDGDLSHMFDFFDKEYIFPVLNKLIIPVKVIVGTKDQYFYLSNPDHPEEAMEVLQHNIKDFSGKLIDGSMHGFSGYEDILVDEIVQFVK